MVPRRLEESLQRLRSEFLAMPRLCLTPGEVARLVNVDPPTARDLLQTLYKSHFLKCTREGRFTRAVPQGE